MIRKLTKKEVSSRIKDLSDRISEMEIKVGATRKDSDAAQHSQSKSLGELRNLRWWQFIKRKKLMVRIDKYEEEIQEYREIAKNISIEASVIKRDLKSYGGMMLDDS